MSARLVIRRAGPLTTIQDEGRFGMLRHGVSASGPMDRGAFASAAHTLGRAGPAGIEFTSTGIEVEVVAGQCSTGFAGGAFAARLGGRQVEWPGAVPLHEGEVLAINPGRAGNFGYLRFDKTIDVPPVLGSRATNLRAGIGGLEGRALRAGDSLELIESEDADPDGSRVSTGAGAIRFIWGLHAEVFPPAVRERFLSENFRITARMDRMGVWLDDPGGVFRGASGLSLVSDAVVAGDIQIVGDGTPVVLMRDHQPTGGYPRIGTIIAADLDRFAQMRPGTHVRFESVSLAHARSLTAERSV
ncbi:biotin-dependent carboxyltransferase family protein [Devosia geojensis]|uniref:5-oxoprolinase subunit C family protein n=1 Tax=Devosia geojensis TaxID=443610 RepID=UPI000697173A|nr:biotin-dependent carboxyltransferase family protein [Devosia geojensis]